jgi:hypothetical protein
MKEIVYFPVCRNLLSKFLSVVFVVGSLNAAQVNLSNDDKPLLRVAIMSDIQGHPDPHDAGMRNLERALDIFAALKPDVVVNDGDINDTGRDSHAVAYYKERCDARLGKIPQIACMGNHEIDFVPKELMDVRSGEVCLKEFNAVFGYGPKEELVHRVIGGYDFIALSLITQTQTVGDTKIAAHYEDYQIAMLKDAVDKAVRRDSKKPVFVVTHYHAKDTVNSSDARNHAVDALRKLFDEYPQIVSISGHSHNPLQDPRSIWQGNFTAIDTSTLCYGCVSMAEPAINQISCLIPYGHESVGCIFLEVFANRLVFRRFSVRDRQEIEPLKPWIVPWPHNPKSAPYSFERRRAAEIPPCFVGDAEPTLWYDFGYIYLMFNAVSDSSSVFGYRIELTADGENPKSYFQLSDYYRIPAHRQNRVVVKAPPNALVPGKSYCCRIIPVGFFGTEGKSIDWTFTVRKNYHCRSDKLNCVQE